MPYASDLTDDQWALLEPLLCPPSKRGPKHGADLRTVVDAMLYVTHTGCQWRFLPAEFGTWTRVWLQFRRWSRNGTWARVLAALHEHARVAEGRKELRPSMVVIDSQLARGASRVLQPRSKLSADRATATPAGSPGGSAAANGCRHAHTPMTAATGVAR